MAEENKYSFSVEAITENAQAKLQEIERMMTNIDRISNKAQDNNNTTNQKDMDKAMRSLATLTKNYQQLQSEIRKAADEAERLANQNVNPNHRGTNRKQREELEKVSKLARAELNSIKKLEEEKRKEYDKTLRKQQELATYQQNFSRNFIKDGDITNRYNLPSNPSQARKQVDSMMDDRDGADQRIKNIRDRRREAERLNTRSESLSRRTASGGYMSHQQFSNFREDYNTATNQYVTDREANKNSVEQMMRERDSLYNESKQLETKTYDYSKPESEREEQEDRERHTKLQRTIKEMDEEINERMEFNRALSQAIENVRVHSKRLEDANNGAGVDVKPERGTMTGMMYERAPAIGLATVGAVAATLGGLYSKGQSVNEGMRDDVISIGQRTGQEDWRENVRDNAFDMGLEDYMGFTGQEMLKFQDNYLSNRGLQSLDDLDSAAQSQAEFSRVTGLNAETTTSFFDDLFNSAKLEGTDVKEIQNAFVGGIKQSGMEGREEDQLNALNTMVDSISRGRTVGSEEVQSLMGLQTILNQTGVKSLQGESGGQLMSDINEGLRGAQDDQQMRLLFGMGTEYQGIEGSWELRKRLDEGIENFDNINDLYKFASAQGGTEGEENEFFARALREGMGVDASAEQVEGLMDAMRSGELTEATLDDVVKEIGLLGDTESQSRLEAYQDSDEALANQSEATTEMQAAQLNDFGDILRKVNVSMGVLPPVVYAAVAALGALAASAAVTAASFGGSTLMRRGAGALGGGRYNRRTGQPSTRAERRAQDKANRPTFFGGMSDRAKDTMGRWSGDDSARRGGLPNTGGNTKKGGFLSSLGNIFGRNKGGGGGNNMGILPQGGAGPFSPNQGGGFGNAAGNMMNKAFLPIAAISGGSMIMNAPEGEKLSTAGSVGGGIGGGMAGASAGAAIGSIAGPLGTIAGGIIGSIAGSEIGSAAGQWLGEKASGVVDWVKDAGSSIWEGAKDIGSSIWEGAKSVGNFLNPFSSKDYDDYTDEEKEQAKQGYENAKERFESFKDGTTSYAENVVNQNRENAKGVSSGMADFVTSNAQNMSELGDRIKAEKEVEDSSPLFAAGYYPDDINEKADALASRDTIDNSIYDSIQYEGMENDEQQGENDIGYQVDRENATKRDNTEKTRQANIREERALLAEQNKIIGLGDKLLRQAGMQNGIFGDALGMGAGIGAGGSGFEVDGSKESIWQFFKDQGFSDAATAGLMGNMQLESNFDPTAENPSSGAFGVFQWLGGRKESLKQFAADKGTDAGDLQTQLEFFMKEISSGYENQRFNKWGGLDAFKNSTDPVKAADIFEKAFERSGGQGMQKRRDYAKEMYNNRASMNVNSNVNVQVTGAGGIAGMENELNNSNKLSSLGRTINNKIYGSLNNLARETRRT